MATIIHGSCGTSTGVSSYNLAILVPEGVSSVSVNRTVSGLGEDVLLGEVLAGENIYSGDILVTSGTADTGWSEPSGITYEVVGDTLVTVTAGSQVALRYGVRWLISQSDPTCERLYDAVGLNFNVASSLEEVVTNDFDNVYPFNERTIYYGAGGKMVRFPLFAEVTEYDGTYDGITICKALYDDDYEYSPIFLKSSLDYADLTHDERRNPANFNTYADYACYPMGANGISETGVSIKASLTRGGFRTIAQALGVGFSIGDLTSLHFIQTLWLVASATRNSQSIMMCNQTGATRATGESDGAVASCGQISNQVGWFYGIENPFGAILEWIDGVNFYNNECYVCTKIANYADDTAENYTLLGYEKGTTAGYITQRGFDTTLPFCRFPIAVGGSTSTYFCDYYYLSTGWRVLDVFGYWSVNSSYGVFRFFSNGASSGVSSNIGARLIYRPE